MKVPFHREVQQQHNDEEQHAGPYAVVVDVVGLVALLAVLNRHVLLANGGDKIMLALHGDRHPQKRCKLDH